MHERRLLFTSLLAVLLFLPATRQSLAALPVPPRTQAMSGSWSLLSVLGSLPAPRFEGSSAYDVTGHRMIVFGGQGLGDTWQLSLSGAPTWLQLGFGPSPRRGAALVFDPVRNRIILFGGDDGNFRNDSWSLDLSGPPAWSQLSPLGAPPAGRMWTTAVYDPVRDRILYFGGYRSDLQFADVWELRLGSMTWNQIATTTGPSPRWSSVGCYEPDGDRLVVALGLSGDTYKNDAWSLPLSGASVGVWSAIPASIEPSPRFLATGVYDALLHRLIVYGGYPAGEAEVWELHLSSGGDGWTQLSPDGIQPPGRRGHVAAFDPAFDRMVIFGGAGQNADTWQLSFVPPGVPFIAQVTPSGGLPGLDVQVQGVNLSGVTSVDFNGTPAQILGTFSTVVQTRVPPGATTGRVHVTGPTGTGTSPSDFVVGDFPQITSFQPDSGKARTRVTIHGHFLTAATHVTFGGSGSATFSVVTDSEIVAIVDTLARTGSIQVSTPVGTVQSTSDFRILPFQDSPRLLSVRDVPHDQGGKVTLTWESSDFDVPWKRVVTGYRVWRRAPAGLEARPSATHVNGGAPGRTNADEFWEAVAQLPAAALEGYAYTANTPFDSTAEANEPIAFFVQAVTTDPFVSYSSDPDSGYSVDNLSPPQPAPFVADYQTYQVAMHWRASRAADFAEFRLYRGFGGDFPLDPAHRIAATRDTAYVDAAPGASQSTYKLVAVDVHGNPSRVALVSPALPVATLASFVGAEPSERSIRLTWYSGGNSGMAVSVSRRDEGSDWIARGDVVVDGSGYVRFEDDEVTPGTRYAYRLGIDDGESLVFTPEVWVTASTPVFSLVGPWPNPSSRGRFSVAFALPTTEPGTLELWDIAGRRVDRREIAGTSRQVVSFGERARLAPGLYLLRMTQGDRRVLRRVVVLD